MIALRGNQPMNYTPGVQTNMCMFSMISLVSLDWRLINSSPVQLVFLELSQQGQLPSHVIAEVVREGIDP